VVRERLGEERHSWLECRCSAYHQSSALYPIIDLIEQMVLPSSEESSEEKIQRLERTLRYSDFSLPKVMPIFARLLSVPLPERYSLPALSPEALRRQTLEFLVSWMFPVTKAQPLILVVEDLHWVDPSTLELLGMIIEQAPTASILLLATFRPGFQAPWTRRSHMVQLTLHPLSRRQVREMVEGITGGTSLPDEVMEEVVSKTDGVPLFVEELTKMVLESGLLRMREGKYELAGPLPPLAIPTTLQDSLMARLDRLGPTKEIIQLGAVLGREFSRQLLETVSSFDAKTLEGALDQLVAAELLYQRGTPPHVNYLFKHALIQETAYQSLLKSMRQQYHARIARALREGSPETVETQPELLAHHYTEAGLAEAAVGYWQLAGQRAVERSSNVEAIHHLNRALELLATLPETRENRQREVGIQTILGVALINAKGYAAEEVARAFSRAQQLCEELGDTAQQFPTRFGLFAFRVVRAEREATRMLTKPLLAFAERSKDPGFLMEMHAAAGAAAFYQASHVEAEKHWERTLALYDPDQHGALAFIYGQDPAVFAYAYGCLNLWLLGYPDRALERAERAIALAERLGHPFSLAAALSQGAEHHLYRREIRESYELSDRCVSIAAEQSLPIWLGVGKARRGWALVRQGETQNGIAQIKEGLSIFRGTGAQVDVPGVLSQLADALLTAGIAEEGLAAIDEALSLTEKNLDRYFEPKLRRLRGELLLILPSPDPEEAEKCFRRALEQSRESHARSLELDAAMSLARLWHQQGRKDEARELVRPIYDGFTEGFDTRDLKEAKALLKELGG
jgi:predicted ATPase